MWLTMERNEALITKLSARSPVAESFRALRTNLNFISPDEPLRTLLLTSSGPGEGKSTTSANLAITMAQMGKKVLLIDCDLRKPVQHKIFELSNVKGITSLLVDSTMPLEEVMHEIDVPGLKIIPCGPIPPNPAELVGSKRMGHLISEFKKSFDLIIFDTPPAISVTDSAILACQVDGVLLVVASNQAESEMVKKAAGIIRNVNAKLLGVIMNRVKYEKGYEYYYYYYSSGEEHGSNAN